MYLIISLISAPFVAPVAAPAHDPAVALVVAPVAAPAPAPAVAPVAAPALLPAVSPVAGCASDLELYLESDCDDRTLRQWQSK